MGTLAVPTDSLRVAITLLSSQGISLRILFLANNASITP